MSECKHCGVDAEAMLARLKAHVEKLDTILWDMELLRAE
jgi:hypothetical protein